ncbi:S8 family serine peptidase [Actinoplanes sp. NPDC051859]|uniref:S8 family serine peptidase n=1 Tax=Actinoplanes sp. NPDC051859 TaxID=3363909 RepID=UPI0037A7F063
MTWMRRWAAALIGASALLVASAGTAPANAGVADGSGCARGRVLNVVAHQDDDLLFMNPDIQRDIDAGRCTLTVFVTAGDAGAGKAYWQRREMGPRAAYAMMADTDDKWSGKKVKYGSHLIQYETLTGNPNVALVFLRAPDGGRGGFPANNSESLEELYRGVLPVIRSVDGVNTYTKAGLTTLLLDIMRAYRPDTIQTMDYSDKHRGTDHVDHRTTALLTYDAHLQYRTPHRISGYLAYAGAKSPANVYYTAGNRKLDIFHAYALHDRKVCQTTVACLNGEHDVRAFRQYVTSTEEGGAPHVARPATKPASAQSRKVRRTVATLGPRADVAPQPIRKSSAPTGPAAGNSGTGRDPDYPGMEPEDLAGRGEAEPADLVERAGAGGATRSRTTEEALAQIGVPDAWKTTTSRRNVTVAVVDTGVTPVSELAGSLVPGANVLNRAPDPQNTLDDSRNSHGTSVAVLIKAVCPACKILPIKAVDKRGTALEGEIAAGVRAAADKGAKIINLSFGAPDQTGDPKSGVRLQPAIDYARSKGAVVLAGAGDDARGPVPYYPAANAGVLAVGGSDSAGRRFAGTPLTAGSNYGADWVDVAAPYCATGVTTAGDPQPVCGTAYSTALASGVAGLVGSRTAGATPWTMENALTSTSAGLPILGRWLTYGEVRAARAVTRVDTTPPTIGAVTPVDRTRIRGTVTVTAAAGTDAGGGYPKGSGVSHALLYADGKLVGKDESAPFAVRYRSGSLNRTVALQWKVFDRAGNVSSLDRTVIADNAGPKLTWKSGPADRAGVRGTVQIKATASDPAGVSRVELWINGRLAQWDAKSTSTFSMQTSRYGKVFTVQLRARDKLGNVRSLPARTWRR